MWYVCVFDDSQGSIYGWRFFVCSTLASIVDTIHMAYRLYEKAAGAEHICATEISFLCRPGMAHTDHSMKRHEFYNEKITHILNQLAIFDVSRMNEKWILYVMMQMFAFCKIPC